MARRPHGLTSARPDFANLLASSQKLGRTSIDPDELFDGTGAAAAAGFTGLPATTDIGHIQLKATDTELVLTEQFYCDVLDFLLRRPRSRRLLPAGRYERDAEALTVTDPSGNPLVFTPEN